LHQGHQKLGNSSIPSCSSINSEFHHLNALRNFTFNLHMKDDCANDPCQKKRESIFMFSNLFFFFRRYWLYYFCSFIELIIGYTYKSHLNDKDENTICKVSSDFSLSDSFILYEFSIIEMNFMRIIDKDV